MVNVTPRPLFPRERIPLPTHLTYISHLSITDNFQGTVYLYNYWPPVSFPPTVSKRHASQGTHQYLVIFKKILVLASTNACQIHQPWEQHDNCSLGVLYTNEQQSTHLSNKPVVAPFPCTVITDA
jgi:hypothetical protein